MIVTLAHIREAGVAEGHGLLCVSGLRTFFEQQGFNWDDIVRNGIDHTVLQGMDHPLVEKAIAVAQEHENGR